MGWKRDRTDVVERVKQMATPAKKAQQTVLSVDEAMAYRGERWVEKMAVGMMTKASAPTKCE